MLAITIVTFGLWWTVAAYVIFSKAHKTSSTLLQKIFTSLQISYCLAILWWVVSSTVSAGGPLALPLRRVYVVPGSFLLSFLFSLGGGEGWFPLTVVPPALSLASSSLLKVVSSWSSCQSSSPCLVSRPQYYASVIRFGSRGPGRKVWPRQKSEKWDNLSHFFTVPISSRRREFSEHFWERYRKRKAL